MKKTTIILSVSLIGLATFGFSYLPYYFDPLISSKLEERERLSLNEGRVIFNLLSGEFQHVRAWMQRNYSTILRALEENDVANSMDSEMIMLLRHALIGAIDAAYASRSITTEERDKFTSEVNNFDSYSSIFSQYEAFLLKALNGIDEMDKKSFRLKEEITQLEKSKAHWWWICLCLQSLGIILSVVSVASTDKKKEANLENNTRS